MNPPDTSEDAASFDPEARELCPDDGCVGVIGPDGRCPICGRRAVPPEPGAAESALSGERTHDDDDHARDQAAAPDNDIGDDGDDASGDDRELCPDGGCIGLIGDDGRCKVCGAPRP